MYMACRSSGRRPLAASFLGDPKRFCTSVPLLEGALELNSLAADELLDGSAICKPGGAVVQGCPVPLPAPKSESGSTDTVCQTG